MKKLSDWSDDDWWLCGLSWAILCGVGSGLIVRYAIELSKDAVRQSYLEGLIAGLRIKGHLARYESPKPEASVSPERKENDGDVQGKHDSR